MNSITDLEDLQVELLSYFKNNLNDEINKLNAEKDDKYKVSVIHEDNFILGEEVRSRQTRAVQLNIVRDDVVVTTSGLNEKFECPFLITVLFYDSMTELDYRKGLRYETAVNRCVKRFAQSGVGEELADVRITRTLNSPVNAEGTTGLRIAGVGLSIAFS